MTFKSLQFILLEGAPEDRLRREAKDAMKHFSYTSYSFRITNAFRKSRLSAEEQEQMVDSRSLLFYKKDLPRYRKTGSFDKYPTSV